MGYKEQDRIPLYGFVYPIERDNEASIQLPTDSVKSIEKTLESAAELLNAKYVHSNSPVDEAFVEHVLALPAVLPRDQIERISILPIYRALKLLTLRLFIDVSNLNLLKVGEGRISFRSEFGCKGSIDKAGLVSLTGLDGSDWHRLEVTGGQSAGRLVRFHRPDIRIVLTHQSQPEPNRPGVYVTRSGNVNYWLKVEPDGKFKLRAQAKDLTKRTSDSGI